MCGDSAAQTTVLLHMLPPPTARDSFFNIPREWSRSYLNWARWLALVVAILLLIQSSRLVALAPFIAHVNPALIAAAVLAPLYLFLGYQVGLGSSNAAAALI